MNEEKPTEDHTGIEVKRFERGKFFTTRRSVIREIPLQIHINRSLWVTLMHSPGREKELALGFCFTEGIFPDAWGKFDLSWEEYDPQKNMIGLWIDHFPSSKWPATPKWADSSDHVGDEEQILKSILSSFKKINSQVQTSFKTLQMIESQVRQKQRLFLLTGAAHAASIFHGEGNYLLCCEDVARSNALDKAIGQALLEGIDLSDKILYLSGRANHVLVRKAAHAQIPIIASVSAPTSLAVKISRAMGITLVGFLRSEEMNIYTGWPRIKELSNP
jgi:FdhD protein